MYRLGPGVTTGFCGLHCVSRQRLHPFSPPKEDAMTEPENLSQVAAHVLVYSGNGDITYDQTIQPQSEFKVSFFLRDGSPAVGILDVIHRNPALKGKGTAKITWNESLEWGPSPTSTDDSWQKVVSVNNLSRSPQDVTIRLFTLQKQTPVAGSVYGDSMEIQLDPALDQTSNFTVKPNSKLVLYPNPAYNKHFVSQFILVEPQAKRVSAVVGAISWAEEWHKFDNGAWGRAEVFSNNTDQPQDIAVTFRTTP